MHLPFRQGLVSYQQEAATPVFLEASVTAGFVSLIIEPTPTIVTFAHGGSDYLQQFDTNTPAAWGPLVSGVPNYLYWDIDLLTSNVSFGITTITPITSHTTPLLPIDGQHWFDVSSTTMKVWSVARNKWQPKVRVLAGVVHNGNTNTITPYGQGSQVGLSTPANPGYIMLDAMLNPVRKSNGEFLTDSTVVRVRSTVGTSGVLVQPVNVVMSVRALENIPAMSVVYFAGPDQIRLASSNAGDPKTPMGIVTSEIAAGEVGTMVNLGEITHDQWNWPLAGVSLYTDFTGGLTTTRPAGVFTFRVGFVKNAKTIVFMIDAETFPQVYQAAPAEFVFAVNNPSTSTDFINGIGERVITLNIPTVGTTSGLMTVPQLALLNSYETRISTNETDIATLELSKAPVLHTHVIANVTGLDVALQAKADKIIPITVGNFAALSGMGNLVDSGFAFATFAEAVHAHTIPDITGLQNALDGKENVVLAGTASQYYRGDKVWAVLDKTAVGLGDVDNTTDLLKPISTTTQTALDGKAATVHGHAISEVSGLQVALDDKASLVHTHVAADMLGGTAGYVLTSSGAGSASWQPAASGGSSASYSLPSSTQTLGISSTWELITDKNLMLYANAYDTHFGFPISDFASAEFAQVLAPGLTFPGPRLMDVDFGFLGQLNQNARCDTEVSGVASTVFEFRLRKNVFGVNQAYAGYWTQNGSAPWSASTIYGNGSSGGGGTTFIAIASLNNDRIGVVIANGQVALFVNGNLVNQAQLTPGGFAFCGIATPF